MLQGYFTGTGQSYDYPSASEVNLKIMGNRSTPNRNKTHNMNRMQLFVYYYITI